MKRAFIIARRCFDNNGGLFVGGIETYIFNLLPIISAAGYHPVVIQTGKGDWHQTFAESDVYCFSAPSHASFLKMGKRALRIVKKINPDYEDDLLIFTSEELIVKNNFLKSIVIQHGIYWDRDTDKKKAHFLLVACKSFLRALRKRRQFQEVTKIVAVDANFLCWYRAEFKRFTVPYYEIYNFAEDKGPRPSESLNFPALTRVIFARRFEIYRGTRVMANCIRFLSSQPDFSQFEFTLAGEGADFTFLQEELRKFPNVRFQKYQATESVDFHKNFDIAVVPTTGSEGTSLSAIEAMSAGCAIIATNIGGLNNIIISGFNGILINPNDPKQLAFSILELHKNKQKMAYLGRNAREVFVSSFSKKIWEEKWEKVLKDDE